MAKQIKSKVLKSEHHPWKEFDFIQHSEFKDISKDQFQKIKQSIINNGFVESFKAWQKGKKVYCLDGFHRCKALKELEQEGYNVPEKMPTDFIDCRNMKEASKLVLIYSSIYANVTDEGLYRFLHDYELDFDELTMEMDLPSLDLDNFRDGYLTDEVDDEAADQIPEDVEPVTKTGDLYLLGGKHRLLCGDCTVKENVEFLMNGEKTDMVFTDPPYGIEAVNAKSSKVGGGGQTKFKGKVDANTWVESKNYSVIEGDNSTETARKVYELVVDIGSNNLVFWGGNYFTDFLPPSRVWFIWDKQMTGNFSEAEMAWTSFTKGGVKIFKYLWNGLSREGNREEELISRVHPTQKPVGMFKEIFENYNELQTILDPFLGSGSTLIACEQTDRICYGMEIDPHYCDVIIQRYKDLTGKEVELIGNVLEKKEAV